MDIHIREALPEDAASIRDLSKRELGYSYPLEDTTKKLTALLASERDKIFVAVAASHKRRGIGRALLSQVEAWGKATGAAGIRLVSGSERKDAHRFYRGCGYCGNKEQINFKKMF